MDTLNRVDRTEHTVQLLQFAPIGYIEYTVVVYQCSIEQDMKMV